MNVEQKCHYLLFAGSSYYPEGGFNDYIGRSETIEHAVLLGREEHCVDWLHVVDSRTMKVVWAERKTWKDEWEVCVEAVEDTNVYVKTRKGSKEMTFRGVRGKNGGRWVDCVRSS